MRSPSMKSLILLRTSRSASRPVGRRSRLHGSFSPEQRLVFEIGLSLFFCQTLIPKVQNIDSGPRFSIFDLLASALDLVLKSTKHTRQRENNPAGVG